MRFRLAPEPATWAHTAPVQVVHQTDVPVPVTQAWPVLADHERWPTWYDGVGEVELRRGDGTLGSRRRVRAGLVTVEEEVTAFEEDRRIGLTVTGASVPGLRTMAEDWVLEPVDVGRCRLVLTVGAAGHPAVAWIPGLLRFVVARSTVGMRGFATAFPAPG